MSPPDTFAFGEYLDVHNDTQTLHFTIMAGHPSSWHIEHTPCQCAKPPIQMVDLLRVYRTGSCPRRTLVGGGTDSRRLLKGMGPSDARNTSAPSPARRQPYLTPQLTTISLAACLQTVATIAADMLSGMPNLYVCCWAPLLCYHTSLYLHGNLRYALSTIYHPITCSLTMTAEDR